MTEPVVLQLSPTDAEPVKLEPYAEFAISEDPDGFKRAEDGDLAVLVIPTDDDPGYIAHERTVKPLARPMPVVTSHLKARLGGVYLYVIGRTCILTTRELHREPGP